MKRNKLIFVGTLLCAGFLFTNSQIAKADTTDSSDQSSTVTTTTTNNTDNSSSINSQQNQDQKNSDQTSQNNQSDQQSQQNNTTDQNQSNQKKTENQTKNGWTVQNGKNYYLVDSKPVKGMKKISQNWYLFDKNGVMLKDVRRIPNKTVYGYFDQNGKRRFKNTSTKRAYYWINKSGTITGIKNHAKTICQRPQMPTGCEITAVTMMINFAGKHITKDEAAKVMPRSLNPNKGFIGSPYRKFPLGFWVAPNGVKPVVQHYLGTAVNMTNCSIAAIKRTLIRSHLVVAWVGWFDHFSNHAIALTGYHGNTLYYNDPWTGTKRSMSIATFKRHWALDGHRALSY